MTSNILTGFSLVDSTGRLILATTVGTLVLGVGTNLLVRGRYAALERDLTNASRGARFTRRVLHDILRSAEDAARLSLEPNTQAIIEDHFQADLKPLLLGERFCRAATGLVIILGLLGTFYGLTASIGKLIQLVAGDTSVADVTQGVTTGLTEALSGMAAAFSNSLVGICSAVILTVLGVISNLGERRVALMIRLETYLDRLLAEGALADEATGDVRGVPARGRGLERSVAVFGASVERLEATVSRFESALQTFATNTRDFTEFNAHLKDNIQRMSLSFGDMSDTLKQQVTHLKRGGGP